MKKPLFYVFIVFLAIVAIFFVMSMYLSFSRPLPIIVKQIELTPQESVCLSELLSVAFDGKGQGLGWVFVTGKKGNEIYLKMWTLWEINTKWIAKCPNEIGRVDVRQ